MNNDDDDEITKNLLGYFLLGYNTKQSAKKNKPPAKSQKTSGAKVRSSEVVNSSHSEDSDEETFKKVENTNDLVIPNPNKLYQKFLEIPENVKPMTQIYIAQLLSQASDDADAPEKILKELSQPSFFKFLENTYISMDTLENLFKLIDFACQCDNHNDVLPLLSRITANHFFISHHFAGFLNFCLEDIGSERASNSLVNVGTFLIILQKFHPASVAKTLKIVQKDFKAIIKNSKSNPDIHKLYTAIQMKSDDFLKNNHSKNINKLAILEISQCLKPPISFRCLSIFPSIKDLLIQPFFRPNLTIGQYSDCDHYLDVIFRLFREDMLHYVRCGVESFKRNEVSSDNKFPDNINIYEDVRVRSVLLMASERVNFQFSLNVDPAYLDGINLEKSNRFAYGSLLCLSTDRFKENMIYGFVSNRNIFDLKRGYIQVELFDLSKYDFHKLLEAPFVLIESTVFVLAYKAPLNILKKLDEDKMPFLDYFVYAKKLIMPPGYLKENTHYDFRPLFQPLPRSYDLNWSEDEIKLAFLCHKEMPSYSYTFSPELDQYKSITLLDDLHWPSYQDVNFDIYQFEAFKAGLTKELALIQGPPGTGKTFIGLRIVQILLHNAHIWGPSPILILCFKNHALDQFLEGLLPITTNLIRLGTRSKSEKLAPFTFSNIMTHANYELTDLNTRRSNLEQKMETCQELIKASDQELVPFDILKEFITDKQIKSFKEDYEDGILKSDDMLAQWLCLLEDSNFDITSESVNMTKNKIIQEMQVSEIKSRQKRHFNKDEEEVDIDYLHSLREYTPQNKAIDNIILFEESDIENENGFDSDEEDSSYLNNSLIIKYNFNCYKNMNFEEANEIDNVWLLDLKQRWRLYRFWALQMKLYKTFEYDDLSKELKTVLEEIYNFTLIEQVSILSKAHIIGATTTGATLQNDLLQNVNTKIVLIEEAAEILEPHIIAPITANTEHLILIGDHQQLRPTTSVHELAVNYGLEVSLFERMINNDLQSFRLVTQHRMRPCIAQLLYPHIYPSLSHHESVLKYEPIKGISSNIYFLSHNNPDSNRKGTKSFYNSFEADFLIELCVYFIYQGYEGTKITILATYQGQVSHIKEKIEKHNICKHVLVTTVDNFQGEENDIILISFVRSNDINSIGFLKISNRVCVSLSRARKGLFCVGNFDAMAKESKLWAKICEELNKQGALVNFKSGIRLRCQNHPNVITKIKIPEDFWQVRYGGCKEKCNFIFACGHRCKLSCHLYDKEHKLITCEEPCKKILCKLKHRCQKLCSQPCGDCEEMIWKELPTCTHPAKMPCGQDPDTYICTHVCSKKLKECGHPCKAPCYQSCMPCDLKCSIQSECGHFIKVPCHLSKSKSKIMALCTKDCDAELECGHICKGKCGECFQGRFHIPCNEICNKPLLCGHLCKQLCFENCPPCPEQCGHICEHSRCPRKCGFPCAKCNEPCQWACQHHTCTNRCHESCDRPPCNFPCPKKLHCGHDCIGFCGEPCIECPKCSPDAFATDDSKSEQYVLLEDCGHIFSSKMLDDHFRSYFKSEEIYVISCPKCKKVIFKNKRYSAFINEAFNNINLVVKEVFGTKKEIKNKILGIIDKYESLKTRESFILKWFPNYETLFNNINNHINNCAFIQNLTMLNNIIKILEFLVSFVDVLDQMCPEKHPQKLLALDYIATFFDWLEVASLNLYHFQMESIKKEAKRLILLYQALKWWTLIASPNFGVEKLFSSLITMLFKPFPFTKAREKEAKMLFKNALIRHSDNTSGHLCSNLTLMPIMNSLRPNWRKCEKGHLFWKKSKSKKEFKCHICEN